MTREIKDGFVSAPKGCYIQLEKKVTKYILDNVRASYGNTAGLVSRVASFTEDSILDLTLANFLDYYHLDPEAIYKFSPFSRICARVDVTADFNEPPGRKRSPKSLAGWLLWTPGAGFAFYWTCCPVWTMWTGR